MPEVTLLPCPACGGKADIIDSFERDDKGHVAIGWSAYCTRGCLTTSEHGSREKAAASWNNLPRALTWTDEPPKEVGNYWWRWDAGSKHWIYNVRLIPTIHGLITYDHSAYDAEHVEDIGGQWAGPIPEPREPKEQGGYDG